jgi:hypothetical protein
MIMKPPTLTVTTLIAVFAGLLPAADPQLVILVMPDAKVLAGINVDHAKTTPFGQYVLSQIQSQDPHLQQISAESGFDPTRNVRELLLASDGAPQTGLVLARGTFDAQRIQTAGRGGGGVTESYKGITVLEDPKHTQAVAFLDATLAVAGDLASVKGAIDRQSLAAPPHAFSGQVDQWSDAYDAWALTTVPPSKLKPSAALVPPNPAFQNAFQSIQQAAAGVNFASSSQGTGPTQVVLTGQAQTDTEQNATALANVLPFLISLAQMQAPPPKAQVGALLQRLRVTSSGKWVNVWLSVAETELEQIMKSLPSATRNSVHRAPRRRRK